MGARKGEDPGEKSQGYIFLHREIRDHWLWQDAVKFQWWIDIIMECNYTPQRVMLGFDVVQCDRGQSVNSLPTWSKRWRVDVSTVRRFLDMLDREGMITRENLGKTTRITVCEYDTYNTLRQSTQSQSNRKTIATQCQRNTNNTGIIQDNTVNTDNTVPGQAGDVKAPAVNLFSETTQDPVKAPEVVLPWSSTAFSEKWAGWLKYRVDQFGKAKRYKAVQSEQQALAKLYKDAKGEESTAIEMIDNAIANTWQGIFPINNYSTKGGNNGTSSKPDIANNQPGTYAAGWANGPG